METIQTRIKYKNLPMVAIAGRPNVGKSTLFNRMLKSRRSITDPTPGVTRDPIEANCLLEDFDQYINLVDTGGFKLDKEGLDSVVADRSKDIVAKADLVLLVMDVSEITPEDESFVKFLRPYSKKVLLVVNKADSIERESMAFNFLRFGFAEHVVVSAEHGRGISDLEDKIFYHLDFSKVITEEEDHTDIRLAIIGKPNTGKSTLMNRLLGEEKSIVSEIAGTTRDVVEGAFTHKGKTFTVLDTAGIRRKGKVTENVEYYSVNRAIKSIDDADVVILMIDAVYGLTDQDKKIAHLAEKKGRGIIFVLNKWDLIPDVKNGFEAARDKLRYFFGQMAYAPVLPLSAKDGEGVDKLLNTAREMFTQLYKRIETGKLNKCMEEWVTRNPEPTGTTNRFKIKYITQVSANPIEFILFVSKPQAVTEAYSSYLRNRIREDLGFTLIPISVEMRASNKNKEEERNNRN